MKVKLHEKQLTVAQDGHRFRVICAGRRWGKSVLSQLVVLQWATRNIGRYWIVSPTYRQGKQIHWNGLQHIIPQDWIAKKNEVELSITLKNGSVIELKGAENPDTLKGVKLRGLVVDEIASIRNWTWVWDEALRPTLTDYEAPAIFISTPKGFNHFYDLFQLGQREGIYKSWHFTSYDNPYIPPEEIDQAKLELGADTFAQEYMAEFTRFTGLIYKEFKLDDVHDFEHNYNQHGDYIFGLDFAVRGWTAALFTFRPPDGRSYHLDEYKVAGLPAKEHARAMIEIMTKYAPLEKWQGFADPAGFAKNQQSGTMIWSLADEYLEEGLSIVRANNEVNAGINYVRQRHREGKIIVHPRCVSYVEEKQIYQWQEQPPTQIGTSEEPEKPRKLNDHIMDSERYAEFSKPIVEEEVKPLPLTPSAQWPKINLDPEPEEKFEEVSFGDDVDFYSR